jgi:2-keto-myo-inositol isomerase
LAAAPDLRFALNHMAASQLSLLAFFTLARALGLEDVEIRNDITSSPILDGTSAKSVRAAAASVGVDIISINALQRFNDWNPAREAEAIALADYASASGARALVLVPANDGSGRADGERQRNVRTALRGLRPILADRGVRGLVEPLGFETSSLRRKSEAAMAIADVGGDFSLVHDTFHHRLGGEDVAFPDLTGLVHISGVDHPTLALEHMRDAHRVLVDPSDRLGNLEQIRALLAAGYVGPFSFEPFAEELRRVAEPALAIRESMNFIASRLVSRAA